MRQDMSGAKWDLTGRKMTESELKEFQLQVERGICKLPISEMEQLVEHVGLESKSKE